MTYKKITDHLQSLANPEIAAHSLRFFKTGKGEYGFGDQFLGIRVPVLRQVVKAYKDTPLCVIQQLLASEYHEVRLVALLLFVFQFERADDRGRKKIYDLYLDNTDRVNNWDLVDSSAPRIVGAYLEDKDRSVLKRLAASPSLWERRIGIVATLYLIKRKDYRDTLIIADQLMDDTEDLIHKATGWMLREVGKGDKVVLTEFLKPRYPKMPRTMLRYAIERFGREERQAYLSGRI